MVVKTGLRLRDWDDLTKELDVSKKKGFLHDLSEKNKPQWRRTSGRNTTIESMNTTHKFNVLRIIWNNLVPEYVKISGGGDISLNARHYSKKYLKEMLWRLGKLVGESEDLSLEQRAMYNQILDSMEIETIYTKVKLQK